MQLKEQSLEQFYTDYLEQYSAARRAGATPTNMHPEDTPTIVFVVDTLIQLCSLPVRICTFNPLASVLWGSTICNKY